MVCLKSFVAVGETTDRALDDLARATDAAAISPDLACVFYDSAHQDQAIFDFVRERFPDAAILGGTSCNGVMSEAGPAGAGSIGLLLIEDHAGRYGTAAATFAGDPAACAARALHAALADAECVGELPELIWVYQTPGREEAVIEGLRQVVGDRCPILGGSAADNTAAGLWRQMGPDGPITDGLVVGVLFSSGGIGYSFQGGYEPTGDSGIVTGVTRETIDTDECGAPARSRNIVSIDGAPAADVYNRWIGGKLSERLVDGGSILTDTTMHPLGIGCGELDDVEQYLLVHPSTILHDGVLSTFAEIAEGTRIHSMCGDRRQLALRAGKVAAEAAAALGGPSNLAGGLVVYCAGCMLAVGDQMPSVSKSVRSSFNGAPFMGCFTFGEQGLVLDRNAHGNLMISAIAFGR